MKSREDIKAVLELTMFNLKARTLPEDFRQMAAVSADVLAWVLEEHVDTGSCQDCKEAMDSMAGKWRKDGPAVKAVLKSAVDKANDELRRQAENN